MSMNRKIRFSALMLCMAFLSFGVASAQTMMPLPPHSYTYSSAVRGYWFTAPMDFTIVGLRVSSQAGSGAQRIQVIKINDNTPVSYPTTSSNFTTLALLYNVTNGQIQNVNISVSQGDRIAVMGTAGTVNSYGNKSSVSATIGGNAVSLTRMGHQGNMSSSGVPNYWTEPNGAYISRTELYYETCNVKVTSQPQPKTLCENEQVQLGISAANAAGYQWQVDEGSGFNDIANSTHYSGATTATLTVTNPPYTYSGNEYRCIANNGTNCLDTSNSVPLTVNGLVNLEGLPPTDTTCKDAFKELELKGTGSITSYKWQIKNGSGQYVDVPAAPPYLHLGNKLQITAVPDTLQGAEFRAVVYGICDSSVSTVSKLVVNQVPTVAVPPADKNAQHGQDVIFEVQSSAPGAKFRWQAAAPDSPFVFINEGGIYEGVEKNRLKVYGVSRVQDRFKFRCLVSSGSSCLAPADTSAFGVLYVDPPASVSSVNGDQSVVLYPNPTNGSELYIETKGLNVTSASFIILDKTGRTIKTGNIEANKARIQVGMLPPDVYMVKILDDAGAEIITSRFTKL